eukprot:scaffold42967_cov176-Amphora_coffeaeformis.AAC.1
MAGVVSMTRAIMIKRKANKNNFLDSAPRLEVPHTSMEINNPFAAEQCAEYNKRQPASFFLTIVTYQRSPRRRVANIRACEQT